MILLSFVLLFVVRRTVTDRRLVTLRFPPTTPQQWPLLVALLQRMTFLTWPLPTNIPPQPSPMLLNVLTSRTFLALTTPFVEHRLYLEIPKEANAPDFRHGPVLTLANILVSIPFRLNKGVINLQAPLLRLMYLLTVQTVGKPALTKLPMITLWPILRLILCVNLVVGWTLTDTMIRLALTVALLPKCRLAMCLLFNTLAAVRLSRNPSFRVLRLFRNNPFVSLLNRALTNYPVKRIMAMLTFRSRRFPVVLNLSRLLLTMIVPPRPFVVLTTLVALLTA